MAALGDKLVDIRIIERNIEKGLISKEEYARHLASLADREGHYEKVQIDPGDTQDDEPRE